MCFCSHLNKKINFHFLYGELTARTCASVGRGAVVAHRYTYAPASSLQNFAVTFIPISVSLWNDLADHVVDGVGLAGFKIVANFFFIGLTCSFPFYLLLFFLISSFSLMVGIVRLGSSD